MRHAVGELRHRCDPDRFMVDYAQFIVGGDRVPERQPGSFGTFPPPGAAPRPVPPPGLGR